MTNLEERLKKIKNSTSNSLKQRKPSRYLIDPELVIILLEEGARMPEIAELYGCSDQTIKYQMRIINPNFDARKYHKWRQREITVEKVVKLYEKLKSSTKIAKFFGVNTHAITDRLKTAGVKLRPLYNENITTKEVAKLYKKHKSTTKVAEILNTNPPLIRRRLDSAGINYRKRKK
tara:strand:+ start:95 stop:622 length:528 start_codon:yes stop_codon:yes gene_type:complete